MAVGVIPNFYARRFIRVDITSTPTTVFAAGSRARFSHCIFFNTLGFRLITFRGVGGGPTVLTVIQNAGDHVILPGWQVDSNGLEVLQNSTGTLNGTFFYTLGQLGAS